MVEVWAVLGLGCAFGTAIADVLTRQSAGNRSHYEAILIRAMLPVIFLLPLLPWIGWPQVDSSTVPWLAVALPLEVLALNLYLDAIRRGVLGETLPFLALTPGVSAGVAYVLLNERIALMGIAGILLVVAGCYFASRIEAQESDGATGLRASAEGGSRQPASRRPMLQMTVVALIYAVTPVLSKGAMKDANPLAFGIAYFAVVASLSIMIILMRNPQAWRKAMALKPRDWVIGASIAAVVLMHFAALQMGPVPYFLALKRLSIVLGSVIGAFALHERRGSVFWLPSMVVVAGAGMIVLG